MLALFIQVNAYAQWSAVNETDDFTDETTNNIVYEDKNHKVEMGLDSDSWFIITRKKQGYIKKDASIIFRVDKNKIYDADVIDRKSMYSMIGKDINNIYIYTNKRIAFKFFSLTREFPRSLHCEMLKGNFLNIRYSTNSMFYEDIKISLKGISKIYYQIYGKKGIPNTECK